jgi:fluoride exporter
MMLAVEVSAVAALGAVCRYLLDLTIQWRHERTFPFGTLTINCLGSLVLGLITGLALHHGLGSSTTAIVGIGFCGGFTTFSTWTWESLALAQSDAIGEAAANVLGSVVLGLAAAAAGLGLAQL